MKTFDLQVNGAFGVNFADPNMTEDAFLQCAEKILAKGCTRFLPTLPTSSLETYRRNLKLMNKAIDSHGLRYAMPGFHIEGPFISKVPGYVGAHHPPYVQEPSIPLLNEFNDLADGKISILTVAPEIPGMYELIKRAHELGMIVSIGHSNASEDDVRNSGADTMTHLGNGLPNLLDRHHNQIWSGLANDDMTIMGICDGHHIPALMLKCYLRCKGVEKFVAVSDACGVAGMPPGRYSSYGNENAILEPNGRYHNPEKGCLVGSSSLLNDCADFLRREKLLPEADIEKVCWINPHKLLKLEP